MKTTLMKYALRGLLLPLLTGCHTGQELATPDGAAGGVTVRFEAARYGVQIIGSELIGIVPMDALVETAEYYLKLENFDKDNQVMEKHLL